MSYSVSWCTRRLIANWEHTFGRAGGCHSHSISLWPDFPLFPLYFCALCTHPAVPAESFDAPCKCSTVKTINITTCRHIIRQCLLSAPPARLSPAIDNARHSHPTTLGSHTNTHTYRQPVSHFLTGLSNPLATACSQNLFLPVKRFGLTKNTWQQTDTKERPKRGRGRERYGKVEVSWILFKFPMP